MESWYLLHTKTGKEYWVAETLIERGFEIYLPEITSTNADESGKQVPFFPAYLFIQVDFDIIPLGKILFTPGLRRIVAYGDQPTPVPEKIINLIRHGLEKSSLAEQSPGCDFVEGESVEILEGPFKGMQAIFNKAFIPEQRAQILLEILGSLNPVEVSLDDLKLASSTITKPSKRPRRTRGRGRRIENYQEAA